MICFRRDNQGKTTWSPASRVIGHEGQHGENIWVLCENVPVLVSAQNVRPAHDAEAIAHAILNGHSVIPESIVNGQQGYEDARGVPQEDAALDPDVVLPQAEEADGEAEDAPYGISDLLEGPLPVLFEDIEDEEAEATPREPRERSRSPPRAAATRRESVAEPDAERTPSSRASRDTRAELLNDLPMQIRDRLREIQHEEAANFARRQKLVGFWTNRSLSREHLTESLKYWEQPPSIQRKIDESRAKEWKKYGDFDAAIPIKGRELSDLLDAGHVPIPSKWVDTIKNYHQRLDDKFEPEFKSRLVSCGNFEEASGVRTDAPTSDLETHGLVAAFAAAHGVPIESSDIKNAYFQATPIDRVVLMRQPSGGLPGLEPDAMLIIRVPVYGLCDSGRGFWKKVDKEARDCGLNVSRVFPAFCYHRGKSGVDCVLTTRVDDFLWASVDEGGSVIDRLLSRFEVGRREKNRLRFCGKQFDTSGHDVLIDVVDNTQKIKYIDIGPNRKASDLLTKGEERQLRSVVGSLSWIARQARPGILYRVSKLQASIKGATVAVLHDANKVLELALKGKDLKLRYFNGPFTFEKLGVLTASDASFAGETGSRPQQGRIHFLCPIEQLRDPECSEYDVFVIAFASTTIKRVCRATLQAETYALQNAQEAGDRIRAALAELRGYPVHGADWETAARSTVLHVTLSDCKSLVSHLNAEQPARVQDKRLQIELSALRQSIFLDDGRRTVEVYHDGGDRVDWIDTATQAADCLTKSMKPDFLIRIIVTGKYKVSRQKLT